MRTFSNRLHCFCTFEKAQNPKGYKEDEKKLWSPEQEKRGKTICEEYEADE